MTDTLPDVRDEPVVTRQVDWKRIGWAATAAWAVALVVEVARNGVPLDREAVVAWLLGGVAALTIGRRSMWTLVLDWLPFLAFLAAYDFARGAAKHISGYAVWTPQLRADRWLFGGNDPTVWLQAHLKYPRAQWWEVAVTLTYCSFFVLPYAVAAVLWVRSRADFRRWVVRFLTLSFLGVVVFVLVPTAPPWAAAVCTPADVADLPAHPSCMDAQPHIVAGNLLQDLTPAHSGAASFVERLSGRGWEVLHLGVAKTLLDKGQAGVDLVAAVPSLHAGTTLLLSLFLWRRVRRRWRPLLALYPLTMAFALVYSAEHYVVDVLAGWSLAALVTVAFGRSERRNADAAPDTLDPSSPEEPQEPACQPTATTPSST